MGQGADCPSPWITIIESQPDVNGRYENVIRLDDNAGGGAFSLVFKARSLNDGQSVCLKFYHPDMQGDQYRVDCFERESLILQMLRDQPDILRLVEPATDFACPLRLVNGTEVTYRLRYIATELAVGDMRQYIYSMRIRSVIDQLHCFRAMCRAVQRMHASRICHRDIKPDNFFRTTGGEVRLGDFGTARLVDASTLPLRGSYGLMWRGDMRYTAPELLCGLDDDATHFFRGDFFALGATLFELLTQSCLTLHIYDGAFLSDLQTAFRLMPPSERPAMFAELIPAIAASRPLPSIAELTDSVPASVLCRIDDLYEGLAALDFRHRLVSWDDIFRRIHTCETILRNEQKYRAYWAQQQQWRRKAQEKQARSRASKPGASDGK